jgi:hypothetical protein
MNRTGFARFFHRDAIRIDGDRRCGWGGMWLPISGLLSVLLNLGR